MSLSLLLCMIGISTSAFAADEPRPNLLVILADDLGYADLQCCGSTDMRTPYLKELFRSGMKFTNAYANCPVCSPTRAALLSGRYQEVVGVPGVIRTYPEDNWGYLDPSVDGIGQVIATLKRNGQWENTVIVFTSDNGGQLDVGANNGPLRDGSRACTKAGADSRFVGIPCHHSISSV